MTSETRDRLATILHKTITTIVYGGSTLGAVVGSYDHLVVWFRHWSTPSLAWLSAGMVEFALVSGLYGIKTTKAGRDGRRWVQGLVVLGVVSAAYANLSWALRYKHGTQHVALDALDTLLGSLMLPVFSLVTVHAWAVVWSSRDGVAPARKTKIRTASAGGETVVASTRDATGPTRDAAEMVLAYVRDAGPSHWKQVRDATGVSRARIYAARETAGLRIERGVVNVG